MYDLRKLRLRDTVDCAAHLRKIGADAVDVDEVSTRVVRFFYEALLDGVTTRPACALVRAYMTYPFRYLDPARRAFAASLGGGARVGPETVCMTLVATAGEVPAWCSVTESRGHQAIPLTSPSSLERLPMIAALVDQLGLDRAALVAPEPAPSAEAMRRAYDVFFVPDAVHSPVVPAQEDFVIPFGVRSVLGFGGALPSGQVLAVLLFSKVPIVPQTAGMFRLLALSLRIAVAPFTERDVFSRPSPALLEVSP